MSDAAGEVAEIGAGVEAFALGDRVISTLHPGRPGTIAQSLYAIALGGKIASIGFLSAENPGIDFFQFKRSGASFRNITVGDWAGLLDLIRVVAATCIRPVIDRVFGFDQAREAFNHLERGTGFGEILIRVD